MDIESRHFRLRTASTLPGRCEITRKATGAANTVSLDELPMLPDLARMPEKRFNKLLSQFV